MREVDFGYLRGGRLPCCCSGWLGVHSTQTWTRPFPSEMGPSLRAAGSSASQAGVGGMCRWAGGEDPGAMAADQGKRWSQVWFSLQTTNCGSGLSPGDSTRVCDKVYMLGPCHPSTPGPTGKRADMQRAEVSGPQPPKQEHSRKETEPGSGRSAVGRTCVQVHQAFETLLL